VWYGYNGHRGIKPLLVQIVGWDRRVKSDDPLLHSSRAYRVAYRTLYSLLPNCNGRGWIC
jgi:hypothetical protein